MRTRSLLIFLASQLGAASTFAAPNSPDKTPQPNPPAQSPNPALKPADVIPGLRVVNRVAATVNGRVVTTNELSFALAPIVAQLSIQFPRRGPEFIRQVTKAKDQILDDLIDRELLIAEFEKMGADIKDVYIDEEVTRIIRDTHGGNRDKFLQDLAKANLTLRAFRDLTRRRMIVQAMRASRYDQGIPPTPAEIQAEYARSRDSLRDTAEDKITIEKIFLPIDLELAKTEPVKAADLQLALAEVILEELKQGKDFAEMAKKYSRDAKAQEGGRFPEMTRKEFSPEFSAVIFDAPLKTYVGPLADPFGFTIVRVVNRKLAPAPPLEKVKDKIDDAVRRRKSAERYEKWMKHLRGTAIINKRV